jgi:hypothetical protein
MLLHFAIFDLCVCVDLRTRQSCFLASIKKVLATKAENGTLEPPVFGNLQVVPYPTTQLSYHHVVLLDMCIGI